MEKTIIDFKKLFKCYTDVSSRDTIDVGSQNMIQLCQSLKSAFFDSFFKNRNKAHFSRTMWSFYTYNFKLDTKENNQLVVLNQVFKVSDQEDIEKKLIYFLQEQAKGTPYLHGNQIMIPFINRPEPRFNDTSIFQRIIDNKEKELHKLFNTQMNLLREERRAVSEIKKQMEDLLGKRKEDLNVIDNLIAKVSILERNVTDLERKVKFLEQGDEVSSLELDHTSCSPVSQLSVNADNVSEILRRHNISIKRAKRRNN